jgi:F-type H+-transporting ATPase subunit b
VKRFFPWLMFFACAEVFAFLIDEPPSFVPIPSWLVRTLLAVNLTAFVYLLARFVGAPLGRFLDTRSEQITSELEEARRKLTEAEDLREQVLRRLNEVEQEVAEVKARAESQGQQEAEEIAAQVESEAERFLNRVDEEIGRRQAEMRNTLASDTAALTAQLTRELLSEEMSDADRERVFSRSLKAMGGLADKDRA